DVKALGCGFYAAAGQKWLLGPDGTGFLYVDQDALEAVEVTRVGWLSISREDGPAEEFRFQPDARRFEVAGHHVPSFAALGKAAALWTERDPQAVRRRIVELVGRLREILAALPGVEVLSPAPEALWSGLVVFRVGGVAPEDVVDRLWQRHRVVCRWLSSPRAVRVSVHAFNNQEDLDRLAEGLRELVSASPETGA